MAAPADEQPPDDDEPTPTEPHDTSDGGDGGGDGPEDGPPPMDVVRGRLHRLVPDTALGLAVIIFLMGVAAAFSGAVLYAYYESRQEATTNKVDAFVGGFADQLDATRKIVKDEGDQAKAQVQNQLDELQKFAASGSTLTQLAAGAQPSIYFVSTLDSSGAPSVGTAFVAFSDAEKSYLLTSYTTIAAATAQPGPDVVLRRPGTDDMTATLFTWDQSKDLALLTVPVPNLTPLKWADGEPKVGDRIFALSGLGSTGVGITQGFVADVSQTACSTTSRSVRSSRAARSSTPTGRSWPSRRAATHPSASRPTRCGSRC